MRTRAVWVPDDEVTGQVKMKNSLKNQGVETICMGVKLVFYTTTTSNFEKE